ncbi:uncharacterized protein LOC120332990 [Styela clava]
MAQVANRIWIFIRCLMLFQMNGFVLAITTPAMTSTANQTPKCNCDNECDCKGNDSIIVVPWQAVIIVVILCILLAAVVIKCLSRKSADAASPWAILANDV